ncbi:CAP domain-containing protein [Dictyobacter kobayashii]|uniref:SCP domain-containing protein n=1 Tax=Dictyobacter kobayashii TaxID=2014872 RepID=A0A402AZ56_9CHLR|nr:CAP domain-containing protein [Dictyobacter kobayashii]GCE24396.1 hypothetical protein KDK_81960 [Dictyobacter kobayashii]
MIKKAQSLKWIISAALFLVLLTACGNAATSSTSQSAGNASSTSHSKNTANTVSSRRGATATPIDVALAPKPTPHPTAGTLPAARKAEPQSTQPPVVPTTLAPQPTQAPVQSGGGGGSTIPAAAQAVFNLINQERAGAGLGPLQWSSQLVQSAHQHNMNMAAANQLSHQLPGEAYFADREKQAGVNWVAAAENIGVGYGDPTTAAVGLNQAMFGEQPPDDGHRRNILSTSCTMVGVDVLVDTQHSRVWLTEDFAAV